MSWHCLQELVEGYSQGANWDGEPSAPSKKNPTLGKYCSDANAMDSYILSLFGMMSPPSADDGGEESWTLSAEGSLARTLVPQEKEQALEENDQGFGATWRELSVRFDPDTCSWKTAHSLFPEDSDWSSLTLPKWGSLHGGELWELMTQVLPTGGKGAGSWPTPMARDYKDTAGSARFHVNPDGSMRDRAEKLAIAVYHSNSPATANLASVAGSLGATNAETTTRTAPATGQTAAALSPDWVELLMGWPMGWTSMEPLTELRVPTVEQWRDGTWELGVPRVGTGIKDRVNRLKAIGNGQVPQAAAMAWRILSEEL